MQLSDLHASAEPYKQKGGAGWHRLSDFLHPGLVAGRGALSLDGRIRLVRGHTHVHTALVARGGGHGGGVGFSLPASRVHVGHSDGVVRARGKSQPARARQTVGLGVHRTVALVRTTSVVLVVREERFLGSDQVAQVGLHRSHDRLLLRVGELRNRDRSQDADDHDHDQKLDQGKALAVAHYFLRLSALTIEHWGCVVTGRGKATHMPWWDVHYQGESEHPLNHG